MAMDIETITDTVEQCLTGDSGFVLKSAGFGITTISELGEVYLRTPGGDVFRMTIEAVSAADAEGWGLNFDE